MADIYLQHVDGTVEILEVSAGSSPEKVLVSTPPKAPLSIANENYAKAGFVIIPTPQQARERSFLVVERDPKTNWTCALKAINYDERYYGNDLDVVTEDVWPW